MADVLGFLPADSNSQISVSSGVAITSDGSMYTIKIDSGGSKIYKSINNGATWTVCYSFTDLPSSSMVMAAKGTRLYLGWSGPYSSTYQYYYITTIDTAIIPTGIAMALAVNRAGQVYWGAGYQLGRTGRWLRLLVTSANTIVAEWTYDDNDRDTYIVLSAFGEGGSIDSNKNNLGPYGYQDLFEWNGYVHYFNGNTKGSFWRIPVNLSASWTSYYPTYGFSNPYDGFGAGHPTNGYMYYVLRPSTSTAVYLYRISGASSGAMECWNGSVWGGSQLPVFNIPNAYTAVKGIQMSPDGNTIYVFVVDTNIPGTKTVTMYTFLLSGANGSVVNYQGPFQLFNFTGSPANWEFRPASYPTSGQRKIAISLYQYDASSYGIKTWVRTFNQPPNAPTLTSPLAGQGLNTRTPTITWTFSDPDAGDTQSAFVVELVNEAYNAVTWTSGWINGNATSFLMPSGAIPSDGRWYLRMQVKDSSGVVNIANGIGPDPNYGGTNGQIFIDTVAPTVGSVTPTTYTKNNTQRMAIYNVADATSGINRVDAYILNKAGNTWSGPYAATNAGGGTWYYDFNAGYEGDGTHLVRFWVYDNANNGAAIDSSIVYDITPPTAPTQTNGVLYATSNGVSWSAFSDGAASSGLLLTTIHFQSWNGSTWNNVATYPKSVTGLSHSFTGLTPGTQYRWGVVYTDQASNVGTLNYTTFTTNTYAVTTITNLTSTGYMLNQKPKITFTATDANDPWLTNFQIQISAASDFSTTILDTTSSAAAAGWGAMSAASGSSNSYTPQTNISTGTRYVRMRAYDGKDWGTWSAAVTLTINATSWPTTVSDTDTTVSKRTIDNLRTVVNNVRLARGLAKVNWTDSVITDWLNSDRTPIRATHLTELRQAVTDIYTALGLAAPNWTDIIAVSTTNRKGSHWSELRSSLLAC